jgi:hypothetical protein
MEFENKKKYLVIGALALTILFLSFLNVNQQSPSINNNLEECKTLTFNDENGINLVFFSPEEDAKRYSDYLINAEPFKDYTNEFNFYYIDSFKPECELYKGIAIFCHSRELIKKAASCPHDYIVVVDELEPRIRSSSYQNVMSINSFHKDSVFLHEFGHAFSNLAEEYITTSRIPRGSENCQSSCDKFKRETDGCFEGCTKTNYYRSIENGVMRTLSTDDFGLHNDDLIVELIENSVPTDLKITGEATKEISRDCSEQTFSLAKIKISPDGTSTNLVSVTNEIGCAPTNVAGDYSYKIGDLKSYFSTILFTCSSDENGLIEGESYNFEQTILAIPKTIDKDLIISNSEGEIIGRHTLESTGGSRLCAA